MKKATINNLIKTKVVIRSLDATGKEIAKVVKKNKITKDGVSVIARLLVDPSSPRPSHVYGRFATSVSGAQGTTNFLIEDNLLDVGYADFIADAGAGIGALREPLFSAVKIEENDDIASGLLTFFFRLTSDSAIAGTFNTASSEVFYLGLAAATGANTPSEDLIFSVLQSHDGDNGIEVPSGGQIAIDYQLTFEA